MNNKTLSAALLLLTLLFSCNQAQNRKDTQTSAPSPAQEKTPGRKKEALQIRKHIPIASDFQNIISIGSINIMYAQGDTYDIELEGDSVLLSHASIDIESGVLTLNIKADSNKDINLYESNYGITAHITAPQLHCVSLCESGNFTCTGKWTAPDIHIGCMSTGQFDINEIECETFKYESTGLDHSTFRHIQAQTTSLFCYRKCQSTFHLDTDALEVYADNASQLVLIGRARKKDIATRQKAVVNDQTEKK